MEQAGLYKLDLYENKGVVITWVDKESFSYISNTGEVISITNDLEPIFSKDLAEAFNNEIKYDYIFNYALNDLSTANFDEIEALSDSIYGFIAVGTYQNGKTFLINTPFFGVVQAVDSNVSHSFKVELKPRKTTSELMIKKV